MDITWKSLEDTVRSVASYMWGAAPVTENIAGVACDCVVKHKPDYWVIVEVTENMTLEKVRTDVGRLSVIKPALLAQNIYVELYIVMKGEPTESMKEAGASLSIKVMSVQSFSNLFINYESYKTGRLQRAFGSSINPFSGEPDNIDYTPVLYENVRTKKQVELRDILRLLLEGKKVVLLGNYGTGKSRCVRELYSNLIERNRNKLIYPLAVNLKDNWGVTRMEELVRRHFANLGLSNLADPALKIINTDRFVFLLDGFDEIGAQLWSDDSSKLKQIRASSLSGVKDLIRNTQSAVLVTGREHYFNSESEMLSALGLPSNDTIIFRCKDEFSDDEMQKYLKSISSIIELPSWLPKRPLICQIIQSLDHKQVEELLADRTNAVDFWNLLIRTICSREAKISPVLDGEKIYGILKLVSRITRIKTQDVGPLTMNEINKAFELVVGAAPVDESAAMLQRLPSLGRISSESPDRQFIDYYILDGLRAEDLIDFVHNHDVDILEENWKNPLRRTGIEILAKRIAQDRSANTFIEFMKLANEKTNKIVAGDILAALVYYASNQPLDLGGLILKDLTIYSLDFSSSLVENFVVSDSFIEEIDMSNCSFGRISFRDCVISTVYGIGTASQLPSCLSSSEVTNRVEDSMGWKSKNFELTPCQMVLISILKRTYYFKDAKRSEADLLSSFGNSKDREVAVQIIKHLVQNRVISKLNESGEVYYAPKSVHKNRISQILSDLQKSEDQIWNYAKNLCS